MGPHPGAGQRLARHQPCLQDSSQPFTHTIAYAMRGLLEIGDYAGREDFVLAACKIGDAMVAALPADGFLPGRFDADWKPTVKWSLPHR